MMMAGLPKYRHSVKELFAVVDGAIHLGITEGCGYHLSISTLGWNIRVLIKIVADVGRRPHRHFSDDLDRPFEQFRIARAQRAIAHIEQGLVVIRLELRHFVGRVFPHAALEILELLGRKLWRRLNFAAAG